MKIVKSYSASLLRKGKAETTITGTSFGRTAAEISDILSRQSWQEKAEHEWTPSSFHQLFWGYLASCTRGPNIISWWSRLRRLWMPERYTSSWCALLWTSSLYEDCHWRLLQQNTSSSRGGGRINSFIILLLEIWLPEHSILNRFLFMSRRRRRLSNRLRTMTVFQIHGRLVRILVTIVYRASNAEYFFLWIAAGQLWFLN